MTQRKIRHELDKYLQSSLEKSKMQQCDGSCESHSGPVKTVRVFHKSTGTDWGYFSYCQEAIKEDTENRGMEIEEV